MIRSRALLPTLLAVLLASPLSAAPAQAFRIIASSSGGAGILQAPCCDTGFDGGFEVSTAPLEGVPPMVSIVSAGGSNSFLVPKTGAPGEFSGVSLSGEAQASMFDIGARATVELSDWDPAFTGETIEVFSSARLEQVFTVASSDDLYVRPVFRIDGSLSHAQGLVSSITFNMRAPLTSGGAPQDNLLLDLDGGPPGTTDVLDLQLVGPDIVIVAGVPLFLSLQLSTQVSGSPNDVGAGDHFGEVDAFNTLALIGFEAYSDAGFSVPVSVDFASDSGMVLPTVPEPGTALLVALGLGALGVARGGRAA